MSDEVTSVLEHFGVKGMKWGVRKQDDTTKTPRKKLSPTQKKVIGQVASLAASIAVKQGIKWARENPDKILTAFARAQNLANGTKAIGPGYEVFKLSMSAAGVYR